VLDPGADPIFLAVFVVLIFASNLLRADFSPSRGCFEFSDTTHFIADCPKRKKHDSSNKYDYTKQNDYSKDDDKKKYTSGPEEEEEVPEDDVLSVCCPR
jgi:hypothetical protein